MIKRDELRGPSCLTSAADDEPIFVLKSTDEIAPEIVRAWAALYKRTKLSAGVFTTKQEAKFYEALALATQMEFWRSAHSASVPHQRIWTGVGELERTGYIDPPSSAEVAPWGHCNKCGQPIDSYHNTGHCPADSPSAGEQHASD